MSEASGGHTKYDSRAASFPVSTETTLSLPFTMPSVSSHSCRRRWQLFEGAVRLTLPSQGGA
jgi:hypothetical protein